MLFKSLSLHQSKTNPFSHSRTKPTPIPPAFLNMPNTSTKATATRPKRTKAMIRNNQFYVEAVVGEKTDANGRTLFLVKWEGYPKEEADWEPSRNISAHFIREWQRANRELEDTLEADEEDEEPTGSSNQEIAADEQADKAEGGQKYHHEELQSLSKGRVNDTEADDNNSTVDAPDDTVANQKSQTQPTRIISTAALPPTDHAANHQTPTAQPGNVKKCNDSCAPMFGADQHSDIATTCNHPKHLRHKTNTCSSCLQATIDGMEHTQKQAHEHGASFKLCLECTKIHTNFIPIDPEKSEDCKCRKYKMCCWCLMEVAKELAAAKALEEENGVDIGEL